MMNLRCIFVPDLADAGGETLTSASGQKSRRLSIGVIRFKSSWLVPRVTACVVDLSGHLISIPISTYSDSTTRGDPSTVTRISAVRCPPGTIKSVYVGCDPEDGLRGKGSGLDSDVFGAVGEGFVVVGVWDWLELLAERACWDVVEPESQR